MSITTLQQRMSAMNPACVWRGVLVCASDVGFTAGNRAAADYLYSGQGGTPPPPTGGAIYPTYFVGNCGRLLGRRGL